MVSKLNRYNPDWHPNPEKRKCEEGIQTYAKTILKNSNIPKTNKILALKTLISSILFFKYEITTRSVSRTHIPKN